MKSFLLPIALLASSAMAQTSSACAADYIVESCLSSQKALLNNCGINDYECMCTQWKNIITYGMPMICLARVALLIWAY
jgi:hypothetical protein